MDAADHRIDHLSHPHSPEHHQLHRTVKPHCTRQLHQVIPDQIGRGLQLNLWHDLTVEEIDGALGITGIAL